MSTNVTLPRLTIADRIVPRTAVTDVALVVAGTALVALLAQLSVPMWPVPITGQTLAVVIVGASLGTWRAVASMALYLVADLAGAPIFSEHSGGMGSLASPSFGYIVGFVFGAALIGWLSQRRWDRSFWRAAAAFALGLAVPYLFGLPWLAASLARLEQPHDLGTVLSLGLAPFALGDVIKLLIMGAVLPGAWWVQSRLARRPRR